MRLLIVTQKVDDGDPILGFFVRWIAVLAARVDAVIVIAQSVGSYQLPGNVEVLSLGKEHGRGRVAQVLAFWRMVLGKRREYDAVFVHMIPLWIVLGGPIWALLRLPITLWYEARGMHWPLRVALPFVRETYSASLQGMPLKTSKRVVTGHGIDTEIFAPSGAARDPHVLVTVGRISAAKHLPLLLHCVADLPAQYVFHIAGKPVTDADETLSGELCSQMSVAPLRGRVSMGPVLHTEIVSLLQRSQLFLHASETGLDKALLEAMSCGCLVLSSSRIASAFLPEPCTTQVDQFPDRARSLLGKSEKELTTLRSELRSFVVEHHGLERLADLLIGRINGLVRR